MLDRMIGALLWNSLMVAGLTSAAAAVLGFAIAMACLGFKPAGQRGLVMMSVVGLALPPFLVTNSWLELLGTNGRWQRWMPFEIHSLTGTVLILTLMMWPICFLLTLAAWRRLQSSQIDSDPALRGISFIRYLLWPMARSYLWAGVVVTFVLALNNFTVPAILQVRVLPAILWVQFNTKFDYLAALQLGWPLVVLPCLLLWVLRWQPIQWSRDSGDASSQRIRSQLGSFLYKGSVMVLVLGLVMSLGVPLGQLLISPQTWAEFPVVLRTVPGAIWNSFAWPALTATVCLGLGALIWRSAWGWLWWIPFLVPGVCLGILLIKLFNTPVLHGLYSSPAMVVVAWVIRYAAPSWMGLRLARQEEDADLADAARLHGGSGWVLLRHVHAPQMMPIAAATWYVTYLLSLWDVETLVLIVPPGGETLALRAFNLLHYGHNAQVNAMCLVLILLATAPAILWQTGRWWCVRRKRP